MRDEDKTKEQLLDELAEETLRKTEEKYKTLFENAPVAVYVAQDDIIKFTNPETEKFYGYSKEEITSKSFINFIYKEDQELVLDRHRKRLRGEELPSTYPFRIVNKAGEIKWVELKVVPFTWENRPASLCFQTDITQRKQEEEQIKKLNQELEQRVKERTAQVEENKERLQLITDSVPVRIATIDKDHRYQFVNQQYEKIFNLPSEKIIGSHLKDIIGEEAYQISIPYIERVLSGEQVEFENFIPQSGEIRKTKVTYIPRQVNERVDDFISLIQDVTEYKEMEEALSLAKEQADTANRAKSQFLANMSHEIRTPLNSIVGFSQILLNKAEAYSLPLEGQRFLENIILSGQNLSELINNILDLSKIEAGKIELFEEVLNLKQLFQSIFHINKAQAFEKSLQFNYKYDSKLPIYVKSDRTKLNQILMNLTSNAIKFTPEGKKVTLIASRDQEFIEFEVVDQGIGIALERWENIFNDFEQADGSTTRDFGGTGLGLAITKKMVSLLKGTIQLNSVLGKGSVFSVRIPLQEAENKKQAPAGRPSVAILDKIQFNQDNVILLVEDNLMNQEVMKTLFHIYRLNIEIADNGQQAIEKVNAMKAEGRLPDLILMDQHMPVMDGFEATRAIRKDPDCTKIPIVMLTADAFIDQLEIALELGIKDYVTKPIDFNKLTPIIAQYLRRSGVPGAEMSDHGRPPHPNNEQFDLLPLPDSVKQKVMEEFEKLSKIPIFMLDDILDQIQKIRDLCQGFDSGYPDLLQQIDQAAYSGDQEQLSTLVQRMFND